MFNSVTINLLYKIWIKIEHYYMNSIIKAIVDKISAIFSPLFVGSYFVNFFKNDVSYFENSLLYKIYSFVIDKCNKFFNITKKLFVRYKETSIIYKSISESTKDNSSTSNTIFLSIMFFSVISLILNFKKQVLLINTLVLVTLFIISVIFLILKINIIDASKDSIFSKLIKSIFSVDEGDDKWW